MKQLILIVICVLGMAFTTEAQKQQKQLLTVQDYKSKIIKVVGVENITYSVTTNNNPQTSYPSTPLCQNHNPGGESWVVFEWNGQWYYGMYGVAGYAEVPITESFARGHCKRNSVTITLPE